MLKNLFTSITALLAIFASTSVYAQSYDDDDIYYNPSKAKKTTSEIKKTAVTRPANQNAYQSIGYSSADTYTPSTSAGVNMTVDEYNRRGFFNTGNTTATTDSIHEDFQATRQIEKFYNPGIITESNDQELAEYYYSQPTSTINIIVSDYPYYSTYWGYPYYASYWGYPYYRTWSYYNWNYGWGPSYSWAWSPAWGWNYGWGPSYWGPSYGWNYPHRPVNTRPGSVGNVRPGYRPGSIHAGIGNIRPGSSANNYRPGTAATGSYRPSTTTSTSDGYRPGRTSTGSNIRGNASVSNSSSGSYRHSNSESTGSSSNNNSGYRRSSSSSSSHSSWGSSSSGGFRGGASTGGVRSGGGGRGRH